MAQPTTNQLQKLLTQARRIAEHREKGSEQEIRRTYQALLKDLRAFLGERYEKLAEGDKLDYAALQRKGEFARFVEETERLVIQHTAPVSESVHKTVQDVYSLCWNGMQDAVKKSADSSQLHTALQGLHGATPEVVKRAVENPISGLTLNSRLQKHRQDVVYGIKQQIGIGLTQGDTYTTMARRVAGEVDGDYKKAVRIVRTETHRVREAGFHDAASDVHKAAQISGYGMTKTWRTMQDERVRPQCRFKRGKKWVTVIRGPYNHQKMEGVCIPVDQQFDLGGGVMTDAPGQSGVAGQDINCRCFLEYSLKKLEDSAAEKNDVVLSDKSDIIKPKDEAIRELNKLKNSGMAADEYGEYLNTINNHSNSKIRQLYSRHADEIKSIKKLPTGGQYSPRLHTIEFSYPKYDDMDKYGTLAHEYGHFFDAEVPFDGIHFKEMEAVRGATGLNVIFKSVASSSDEFLGAIRKDKEHIKSILTHDAKMDLASHNTSHGVQDAIDGLFPKSRINWGHGERYYNRKYASVESLDKKVAQVKIKKNLQQVYKNLGLDASNQTKVKTICRQYEAASEAWANIMSAEVCGGEALEYVKQYLPNSYRAIMEILKGMK